MARLQLLLSNGVYSEKPIIIRYIGCKTITSAQSCVARGGSQRVSRSHHQTDQRWNLSVASRRRSFSLFASPFSIPSDLTGDELLNSSWDSSSDSEPDSPPKEDDALKSQRQASKIQRFAVFLFVTELACVLCVVAFNLVQASKWRTLATQISAGTSLLAAASSQSWQILLLSAAVLVGIFSRLWLQRSNAVNPPATGEAAPVAEAGGDRRGGYVWDRLMQLEEDVGTAVKMLRVLSRQVEKLGVQFRVTRRTLKDPMKETSALAESTSQLVELLDLRTVRLEKELQELQMLLLATQDQSGRQFSVLSSSQILSQQRQRGLEQRVEEEAEETKTLVRQIAAVTSMLKEQQQLSQQNSWLQGSGATAYQNGAARDTRPHLTWTDGEREQGNSSSTSAGQEDYWAN